MTRRGANSPGTHPTDAIAVASAHRERPATRRTGTSTIDVRLIPIFDDIAARRRKAQTIHSAFATGTMLIRRAFNAFALAITRMPAIFGARRADGFIVETTKPIGKTSRLDARIRYARTITVVKTNRGGTPGSGCTAIAAFTRGRRRRTRRTR